jgi:hypothetical protein
MNLDFRFLDFLDFLDLDFITILTSKNIFLRSHIFVHCFPGFMRSLSYSICALYCVLFRGISLCRSYLIKNILTAINPSYYYRLYVLGNHIPDTVILYFPSLILFRI